MRAAAIGVAVVCLVGTGCFSPRYADGTIRCSEEGCPGDLTCAVDGLCYRTPPPDCDLGSTAHCAACDVACAPSAPLCAPTSGDGFRCVASCDSRTECGGRCIDTDTSGRHCGQCDRVCSTDNGAAECVGGECQVATCDPDWGDCNETPGDGCETELITEQNCGTCGNICGALQLCSGGQCVACPDSEPTLTGSFTASEDPIVNFDVRAISGSGNVITVRDGGNVSGTLTLSGATISGSFTGTNDEITTHDLRAISGSDNVITVRDGANASGTLTLTGATISGAFTATDDGFSRFDIRFIGGSGNVLTVRDGSGASGTLTLAGVPTCP